MVSALSLLGALACSGDPGGKGGDDDQPPPNNTSPDGGMPDEPIPPPPEDFDYVYPEISNTGFDGTNTFKLPLATNLQNATWTAEDPTIVDIAPAMAPAEYADFGETWVLVTTKKAGMTKITATAGAKKATATVVVAAYTPAVVAAGKTRYTTDGTGARVSCISCHGQGNGVDHSPLQMAYYEDAEILSAITTGKYPGEEGYELQGVPHMWNVTDAEKAGIVPYLRSLPPRGF